MSPLTNAASTPAALISVMASSFIIRQYGTSVSSARIIGKPGSSSPYSWSAVRRPPNRGSPKCRSLSVANVALRRAVGAGSVWTWSGQCRSRAGGSAPTTSMSNRSARSASRPSMRSRRVPAKPSEATALPSETARSSPSTRMRAGASTGPAASSTPNASVTLS
jgi:hypothetical protein